MIALVPPYVCCVKWHWNADSKDMTYSIYVLLRDYSRSVPIAKHTAYFKWKSAAMVSFRIFMPSSPRYEKRQVLHVISIARIMDGKKKDVKNLKKKTCNLRNTKSDLSVVCENLWKHGIANTWNHRNGLYSNFKRNIYMILSA